MQYAKLTRAESPAHGVKQFFNPMQVSSFRASFPNEPGKTAMIVVGHEKVVYLEESTDTVRKALEEALN